MSKQRTYAPKEHSPLASIEDWEDFVVVRYPEEGKPANSEKDRDAYRNYDHPARDSVREFYRLNHTYQTYDFVREKEAEFLKFDRKEMAPWEAVEYLNTLVDDSDPDIDLSQLDHLLQTAEAIRADGHPDWFVLTELDCATGQSKANLLLPSQGFGLHHLGDALLATGWVLGWSCSIRPAR